MTKEDLIDTATYNKEDFRQARRPKAYCTHCGYRLHDQATYCYNCDQDPLTGTAYCRRCGGVSSLDRNSVRAVGWRKLIPLACISNVFLLQVRRQLCRLNWRRLKQVTARTRGALISGPLSLVGCGFVTRAYGNSV